MGSGMQQSDEYTPNAAHVSALTLVVQTQLAHVLALLPTQEAADALVARLRRASRHVPRFVADDDQHASPVSPYEEEIDPLDWADRRRGGQPGRVCAPHAPHARDGRT